MVCSLPSAVGGPVRDGESYTFFPGKGFNRVRHDDATRFIADNCVGSQKESGERPHKIGEPLVVARGLLSRDLTTGVGTRFLSGDGRATEGEPTRDEQRRQSNSCDR